MKKRIVSLALALMMCFSLSVTAFAEAPIDQAREWAEEVGLPTEFLTTAHDETLLMIYNDLKDSIDLEFVYSENNQQTRSIMDYLTLSTLVAKSTNSGYIEKVTAYLNFEWDPDVVLDYFIDGVTATWPENLFIFDSVTCRVYDGANDQCRFSQNYLNELGQGSMGVHFDATFFTGNPYGTIGLGLTPRTAMPNTSTTVSQVTFTYGYGADETAVGVTAGPVNVTFSGLYWTKAWHANVQHG